ncbi:MAG: lipid-A-disaccharide synthase [Porticoccaceae bacterium]|jgi:lipid-A-disaccharide synthase
MAQPLKIGIVAGEVSGDLLGGELIRCLRTHFPDAEFQGMGGETMIAAGLQSLFPMDRLSVMGFVEPLKRLPELLHIRKTLYRHFLDWGADLVVGIDSPDFNLGLELKLRRCGVLTAHYVSPSVWAWRQGRVKKIARAVDLMLTLLPFESDFYRQHQVPVAFVGHPLADRIPLADSTSAGADLEADKVAARVSLGLDSTAPLLAIMPGSRGSEVALMGDLFLQAARQLHREAPQLKFVIPSANSARHSEISQLLSQYPDLPVTLVAGNSHTAMAASDAVLLTSGTTALEAMLLKKPMVVAYRLGGASFWLASKLVKTPYISLPNLVAGEPLVPELIQDQANVANLVTETRAMLFDKDKRRFLESTFTRLHQSLSLGASATAASALAKMINERRQHVQRSV